MAVETADDRAALLADYGVTVTKADTTTFTAIFDETFIEVDPTGATRAVESSDPQIMARTADVSALVHGSLLTISGSSYKVIGIEPDGTGITTLILEVQ